MAARPPSNWIDSGVTVKVPPHGVWFEPWSCSSRNATAPPRESAIRYDSYATGRLLYTVIAIAPRSAHPSLLAGSASIN